MLVKVANKETQTVVSALTKHAKKLPTELYKSLTWDRGKELAAHQQFTLATDIDVYFCDPQVLGSGDQMRIQMDCFGNTSPKEQ
jgi:IS30 family transposase